MKRVGHIFDSICEMDNLREAFLKASRGKRLREDQRLYAVHLDDELQCLRQGLLDGSYPVGDYRRFKVYDPKEREICAAAFGERVLHHALMNICEPFVDKWLIYDTYACRKGKGQLKAVQRAQQYARRYKWFLKCDIRKFFDSVPHEGVRQMLGRKFKDPRLLDWFSRILNTYDSPLSTPDCRRGLPIGNLTSQHFANLYLDALDRCIGGAYVRYMDDFVVWSDDKSALLAKRDEIALGVTKTLGLTLKETPFANRTVMGMDFLGLRVFPRRIALARRSRDRYRRKARHYESLFSSGAWDEQTYQERLTALTAFTQQADATAWRRTFWHRAENVGEQPPSARRQLEQQREQLPLREPQQQQPVEQEQQLRVSTFPALSIRQGALSRCDACSDGRHSTKTGRPHDAGSRSRTQHGGVL